MRGGGDRPARAAGGLGSGAAKSDGGGAVSLALAHRHPSQGSTLSGIRCVTGSSSLSRASRASECTVADALTKSVPFPTLPAAKHSKYHDVGVGPGAVHSSLGQAEGLEERRGLQCGD
eukprot:15234-Rhodomonas_salina.1